MTYIPNTDENRKAMLGAIGVEDVSDLFAPIPGNLKLNRTLNLPAPLSEMELRERALAIGGINAGCSEYACFLGAGAYDHYIPSTIPAVLGRSEFYTSYTPYQPEISQGNLQAIWEFQSMVCHLMQMDAANASMYDGASALAEAALMASGITRRGTWYACGSLHPNYRKVLETHAWASGHTIINAGRDGILSTFQDSAVEGKDIACVIVQSPNFFGAIEPLSAARDFAKKHGALLIVCCDPISLGLLNPPGAYDADICVAEGQPLGISMSYGGPLLGLFACKKAYVRQMPGRVVGATTDTIGRRGYTLTLQTREQHIRRERATSNICSNQALCALAGAVYLSTLGKNGLRRVAELCTEKAHYAAERLTQIDGVDMPFSAPFFKEFVVRLPRPVQDTNMQLAEQGIMGGLNLEPYFPEMKNCMLICVTEQRTKEQIDRLAEVIAK